MKLFGKKTKAEADQPEIDETKVKPVSVSDATPADKPKAKKSAVKPAADSGVEKIKVDRRVRHILLKPIVSEKATLANSQNKYLFVVSSRANKSEIKKAIKEIYSVVPASINIINRSGKDTVYRGHAGKTSNHKRAIVTLKKGDSIKIYEGI